MTEDEPDSPISELTTHPVDTMTTLPFRPQLWLGRPTLGRGNGTYIQKVGVGSVRGRMMRRLKRIQNSRGWQRTFDTTTEQIPYPATVTFPMFTTHKSASTSPVPERVMQQESSAENAGMKNLKGISPLQSVDAVRDCILTICTLY